MSAAVLVDTNILVYWLDSGSGHRHVRANDTLECLGFDRVALSTQVLSELANVMTHPHKMGMGASDAADTISMVSLSCEILSVNTRVVLSALHARDSWQLEYYDAQIWATAALNDVPVVLSEDFAPGTTLGGVTFLDPFADDFDLSSL
jgi:predicted nucleic acid-binding protein